MPRTTMNRVVPVVLSSLLSAAACTSEKGETHGTGTAQLALATDDAALAQLWEIYRDLENARHRLEQARQSVQPNSLREEIRLRMEEARMQLERGREHIEMARVQRTEQAFYDAAVELNLAAERLEAERLVMAVPPIQEMLDAQQQLALMLFPDPDVPTHVTLRAVPLGFPDYVDHVSGTTVVSFDATSTEDGCQLHGYATDTFIYNLVSEQPFDCPDSIELRAINVWNGAPLEEWRQTADSLPSYREFMSNGRYVCSYREPDWRFRLSSADNPACFHQETPLLVLLMDFADTDLNGFLANAETVWGEQMFGEQQAQGNHYWNEVLRGKFRLKPVVEDNGVENNGVVRVTLSSDQPTSGSYVIEDQPWVPEALDLASQFVEFDAYDSNGDGVLQNTELSVLLVPNLSLGQTSVAGAQANINLDHAIAGTGVVLDRFARTNFTYTSIGTNMHELAHHMLDLDHFTSPTEHGLMGLGAYGEDPVITRPGRNDHYATRPTHLIGTNRFLAGTVVPEVVTATRTVTLNSIHTGNYNLIAVPVVGGTLYIENRTNEGYDQSIPFCDGDAGGIFMTELLDTSLPLHTVGIEARRDAQSYDVGERDFCEYYSLAGRNDSFSYGGYTFTNMSGAGSSMTLDIVDNGVSPVIDNYKFEWWVLDPNREGYRMRHYERPVSGQQTVLDFDDMEEGAGVSPAVGITLHAYYDTGEVRSVNHEATWTSSSAYVDVVLIPLTGVTKTLVNVKLDASATPVSTATITVAHSSGTHVLRLDNIPDITN